MGANNSAAADRPTAANSSAAAASTSDAGSSSASNRLAQQQRQAKTCCNAICCCAPSNRASTPSSGSEDSGSDRSHLLQVEMSKRAAAEDPATAAQRAKELRFSKGAFVLPGSEAQAALARRAKQQLQEMMSRSSAERQRHAPPPPSLQLSPDIAAKIDSEEWECVICLGSFSWEDPAVLTLCSCGINRTAFHYACLLQWLELHSYCPACRGELYFEESSIIGGGAGGGGSSGSTARTR